MYWHSEAIPIQEPEFITFSFLSKVIVYGCIYKIPNKHYYIFIETYTLVIITWLKREGSMFMLT